jgi:transposase
MITAEIESKSSLPDTVDKLQDFAWELVLKYKLLEEKYRILSKQHFGQKSEKFHELDAIQMEMSELLSSLGDSKESPAEESFETVTIEKHTRKKRHPGRNVIPDNVEEEKHVLDISDSEKTCECCGNQKVVLYEKEHTVIERIPAQYKKHVYLRPVYGCSKCKDSISMAEPVSLPIPKGLAGPHLLVFVILSKYLYHLPLYRIQRQIFHEGGIWFTRSTMVSWLRNLHKGIRRIHKELLTIFKQSRLKHADESRVSVRYADIKGKHHTGQMWVGLGKDSYDSPSVGVFCYNDSRSSDAARSFLKGSHAGDVIMVDGYESYTDPIKKFSMVELNCMAHSRRKFTDARTAGYKKDFVNKILRKIGQLYRIERWATKAEVSVQKRYELRQQFSTKILDSIKSELLNPGFVMLPGRKVSVAIHYMLNRWQELNRYTENGEYPIDNNSVEQIIRALAIGRKNWQFAGSKAGAKWMAAWYSLLSTCKINNINPHDYILDIIQRLPLRPENMSVKDLTPVEWAKNNKYKNTPVNYPKG